jgi:hypothetical protein
MSTAQSIAFELVLLNNPPLFAYSGEPNPEVTRQAIEMCYDDMKQLYHVLGREKSLKSKIWLYSF